MKSQCGLQNLSRFEGYKLMLTGNRKNKKKKHPNTFWLPNLNVTSTENEFALCFHHSTSTILQQF